MIFTFTDDYCILKRKIIGIKDKYVNYMYVYIILLSSSSNNHMILVCIVSLFKRVIRHVMYYYYKYKTKTVYFFFFFMFFVYCIS